MGQFDDLKGELQPGQSGWLPISDDGTPNGSATLLPPEVGSGIKACSVTLTSTGELVTLAGAPLEPPLNANNDYRVLSAPSGPAPEPQAKAKPKR